jgi:hypothetical protein
LWENRRRGLRTERELTLAENDASGERLKAAVADLYRTFSRYPADDHFAGCPHCVTDADHALLHSKPLRELQPRELSKYAFKAMSTWGSDDDFRHFLPRIFELLAFDGGTGDWTDPEIAFGKLSYGNWRAWPDEEQTSIVGFFHALWSNVLDHFPHAFDVGSCLCCIGQAVDYVSDYLGAWHIAKSLPAARHFSSFMEDEPFGRSPEGISLAGVWWQDRRKPAEQIARWLRDPVRRAEVQQALDAFGKNPDDAKALSNALNQLGALN